MSPCALKNSTLRYQIFVSWCFFLFSPFTETLAWLLPLMSKRWSIRHACWTCGLGWRAQERPSTLITSTDRWVWTMCVETLTGVTCMYTARLIKSFWYCVDSLGPEKHYLNFVCWCSVLCRYYMHVCTLFINSTFKGFFQSGWSITTGTDNSIGCKTCFFPIASLGPFLDKHVHLSIYQSYW